MQFEENGERIDDLKLILSRVVQVATLFDDDGISIRFMNTSLPEGLGDNVASEQQINHIMSSVKFSGKAVQRLAIFAQRSLTQMTQVSRQWGAN